MKLAILTVLILVSAAVMLTIFGITDGPTFAHSPWQKPVMAVCMVVMVLSTITLHFTEVKKNGK